MADKELTNHTGFSGRVANACAGGFLGGALAGVVEGIVHVAGHGGGVGPSIFFYGLLLYGFFGLLFGVGFGILLGIGGLVMKKDVLKTRTLSLTFALFFAINFLVIGRFRVYRDLLHEQPIPLLGNLAILLAAAVMFFLFRMLLNMAFESPGFSPKKMRVTVALAIVVILIPLWVLGDIYNSREMAQDGELNEELQAGLSDKPNLIFIILDTMRADYLGCYGYKDEDLSPNLDKLAEDSAVYTKMFSQSSYTKPSIASHMTSLYPSTHNTVLKPDALPEEITTLAEALHDHGYYTTGFANNPHISALNNFDQGYDEYYFLEPDYFFGADRSSSQLVYYSILRKVREKFISGKKWVQHYYQDAFVLNEYVMDWLGDKGDRRFFLFVHYMDTHDPYFEHPANGVGYARVSMEHPDPDMAPELLRVYKGEIKHLDNYVGELLDWLKAKDLYDQTAIVITADHGEEFFEHEGWWHGTTLYSEQINVPLIIKYPYSRNAGQKLAYQVQAIDIAPTFLHLAGSPIPQEMQGVNLMGYTEDELVGVEYVYSEEELEGNIIVSVKTPDWKLIRANKDNPRGLNPVELYDMNEDYTETMDLAALRDSVRTALDENIKEFKMAALGQSFEKQETEIDDAAAEQLRALGYVQ